MPWMAVGIVLVVLASAIGYMLIHGALSEDRHPDDAVSSVLKTLEEKAGRSKRAGWGGRAMRAVKTVVRRGQRLNTKFRIVVSM